MPRAVITGYPIVLFILMLALSCGIQADVFKCVINGVTTYSDSPCGGHVKKMDLSAETPVQNDIGKPLSKEWLTSIAKIVWQFFSKTWYLILIIIAISIAILKTPRVKGIFGESVVNLMARILLNKGDYHLIRNVTLPTKDGTTQIDHVIVSPYGVFVIETKNMKGWIFGSPNQKSWTQKIYKHTNTFQNPLHQNEKHVKALTDLLGIRRDQMYSVVAFVGESTFKTPMPENVTEGRRWIRFVKSRKRPVFSDEEVERIIEDIETGRLARSMKTNREHVKHVRNIVSNKQKES